MKTITIKIALVILCVALLGSLALSLSSKSEPVGTHTFPTKTETRHYLQPEGHKEVSRAVEYYSDGWTIKSITVFYTSGGELVTTFFEDGSPNKLVEFYPPEPNSKKRLKRKISYALGQPTVIVDAKFFRSDGTLSAQGGIRSKGVYEQFEYDNAGLAIERHEAFLSSGEIVYRKVFLDSLPKIVVEEIQPDVKFTVSFREDGTRLYRVRGFEHSNNELYEFFNQDGITRDSVVFRFDKIGVVYLNPDGSLKEARRYENGKFQVVVYKPGTFPAQSDFTNVPKAGVRYKQYWSEVNGDEPLLTQLDEYRSSGSVYRRLYFDDSELSKAEYLDSDGDVAHKVILKPMEEDDSTITLVIPGLNLPAPQVNYNRDSTLLVDRPDPSNDVGSPVEEYYPYEGYYDDYEEYYNHGPDGYPVQETLDFP